MSFDFDKLTERRNTGSLKYDFAVPRGRPKDVLPLWVADMDFPTAPCVQEALQKAVAHGIFGYSEPLKPYFDALLGWFSRQHGYEAKEEWVIKTPGVVFALAAAVRALTEPGDGVLILTPVYYPFYEVIRYNGRTLVESPLQYRDGRYTINFDDMEQKIQAGNVKLLLFCSPHNPMGRVWTQVELEQVAALCKKYDLLVVSDEIHCDFTWPGHTHIVFPTVSEDMAQRTILCTAPTKTFNLAGLQISNIFIENPQLRQKFQNEVTWAGYSQAPGLGLIACQAAYARGEAWLEALKAYLVSNLDYLRNADLPGIRLVEPEGTYLCWLDCSGLGLSAKELEDLVLYKANLWLDGGRMFGEASAQFQRVNIACPRATLQQAVSQLRQAICTLK